MSHNEIRFEDEREKSPPQEAKDLSLQDFIEKVSIFHSRRPTVSSSPDRKLRSLRRQTIYGMTPTKILNTSAKTAGRNMGRSLMSAL